MNQSTYNSLKSFIWGIANDCLVDVYDVGDYRKIILKRVSAEINLLQELRTKIIADVVTGQIDVRDEIIPEYDNTEETEPDDELENDADSEEESDEEA